MNLQKPFQFIRNRWHPLWRLRRTPLYRYLQSKLDFVIFIRIPKTKDKIAIRFLRDLSWFVNSTNLEPEVNNAFKTVLELLKPKVFWDIGANIGFYSWYVRQYPSIEQAVLFEPDPVNFSLLQKTIRKNKITNRQALNTAVSDQVGEVTFVVDQASGATGSLEATSTVTNKSSLHAHYGMGGKVITCSTVSIDSLASTMSLPDFMKIDVEGAEHLVISGAKQYMDQHKPTLIMETANSDLIRALHNNGYTVFQIDDGNFLFVSNTLGTVVEKISETIPLYLLTRLN